MEIKDFKEGQKVWVKLTGNAVRGKSIDKQIEEWVVVSVGRKYVTAENGWRKCKFETCDWNRNCLKQVTNYCVDYLLYFSKEIIEEEIEKAKLFTEISKLFRDFGSERKFTLEQLREILKIIWGENNGLE